MDEKIGKIWSHFENMPFEKINFGRNSKNRLLEILIIAFYFYFKLRLIWYICEICSIITS